MTGGLGGGAASGGKALALGRALGSQDLSDMIRFMVTPQRQGGLGMTPDQIMTIGNPATEIASHMKSVNSIHFNLKGTSAGFLADQSRYTAQEWQYILDNVHLHPKVTVYNPPSDVYIPPTIGIGSGF